MKQKKNRSSGDHLFFSLQGFKSMEFFPDYMKKIFSRLSECIKMFLKILLKLKLYINL